VTAGVGKYIHGDLVLIWIIFLHLCPVMGHYRLFSNP